MDMQTDKKKFEPSLLGLLLGLALMAGSIYFLLNSITVSSIHFYRFGQFSSGPILIFLFVIFLVWAIAKGGKLPWFLVFLDILCLIGSAIMGTRLYLKQMNLFTLLLMVAMFAVGLGLFLKNIRSDVQ